MHVTKYYKYFIRSLLISRYSYNTRKEICAVTRGTLSVKPSHSIDTRFIFLFMVSFSLSMPKHKYNITDFITKYKLKDIFFTFTRTSSTLSILEKIALLWWTNMEDYETLNLVMNQSVFSIQGTNCFSYAETEYLLPSLNTFTFHFKVCFNSFNEKENKFLIESFQFL